MTFDCSTKNYTRRTMRRITVILSLFIITVLIANATNTNRTPDELTIIAKEAISKVIDIPTNSRITVEPIHNGQKVVFEMPIPEGFWTMSKYPEVHFVDKEDTVVVRVWDKTKANKTTPSPEALSQWFLQKNKKPDLCITLMSVWFDANRNKGRVIYAYDRYARAYREADKEHEWLAVLENELKMATAPDTIYEIHKHMALLHHKNANPELAIKNWQLAKKAMVSQSTSYRATRYAKAFFQIAMIQVQEESFDKAERNLETYLGTIPDDPIAMNLLGDIYESKANFDKARELYMSVLAEDFDKNWDNKTFLEQYRIPFRERIRRLDLQEKLAALIIELADDNGKVRMDAFRAIQAMGKDIHPFLDKYLNHENLEIRGSMQDLIKNNKRH